VSSLSRRFWGDRRGRFRPARLKWPGRRRRRGVWGICGRGGLVLPWRARLSRSGCGCSALCFSLLCWAPAPPAETWTWRSCRSSASSGSGSRRMAASARRRAVRRWSSRRAQDVRDRATPPEHPRQSARGASGPAGRRASLALAVPVRAPQGSQVDPLGLWSRTLLSLSLSLSLSRPCPHTRSSGSARHSRPWSGSRCTKINSRSIPPRGTGPLTTRTPSKTRWPSAGFGARAGRWRGCRQRVGGVNAQIEALLQRSKKLSEEVGAVAGR